MAFYPPKLELKGCKGEGEPLERGFEFSASLRWREASVLLGEGKHGTGWMNQ